MWQLDGTIATLTTPQLTARVDLRNPGRGLQVISVRIDNCHPLSIGDARLFELQLDAAIRPSELYCRGTDIFAKYPPSDERPLATDFYWRFTEEYAAPGIELIASTLTDLLDSSSQLAVVSDLQLPMQLVDERFVIAELPDSPLCYVELAHPSNLAATTISDCRVTHELFPGHLEKGVIRRARILGVFLPAMNVGEHARAIYQRFVNSTPPLTT